MWFIDVIVERCYLIRDWFWYLEDLISEWELYPISTTWVEYCFYHIGASFDEFGWRFENLGLWLDYAESKLLEILSWDTLLSYIKSWLFYIGDLTTVFLYFVWNVLTVITSWWADISALVQGWIDDAIQVVEGFITQLETWLTTLQAAWDAFKGKIPSIDEIIAWWSNWWALILAQIIAWGALTVLQIQSLIDSAFALRDEFWAGWQDVRDQVLQFFTDPWAWLYDRFDDFIERFW